MFVISFNTRSTCCQSIPLTHSEKRIEGFFANNIPSRNCIVFFSNLHCDLNNAIEIPIVFDKLHRTYDG